VCRNGDQFRGSDRTAATTGAASASPPAAPRDDGRADARGEDYEEPVLGAGGLEHPPESGRERLPEHRIGLGVVGVGGECRDRTVLTGVRPLRGRDAALEDLRHG
jgi:hypothetical protein